MVSHGFIKGFPKLSMKGYQVKYQKIQYLTPGPNKPNKQSSPKWSDQLPKCEGTACTQAQSPNKIYVVHIFIIMAVAQTNIKQTKLGCIHTPPQTNNSGHNKS